MQTGNQQQAIDAIFLQPLPYNQEAEQAVLGAMLLDPEAVDAAADRMRTEDFYRVAHQRIFGAMLELLDAGEPVDVVTVTTVLQDKGHLEDVEGITYLSELAGAVPTTANVDYYIATVKDKANHREAILEVRRQVEQVASAANGEEIAAIMQRTTDRLADKTTPKQEIIPIGDALMTWYELFEQRANNALHGGGEVTGIPSGFDDLDRMTSGFQRSDFIIVAARPSVGKTAFALNIAQNVGVRYGEPVAIFSLEMGASQLVQRMVCAEGNIDASRMRTGRLEGDEWTKVTYAIGVMSEAPIYIDDTPGATIQEIRAKCRRLKKEKGLGMILIDYLQLIQSGGRRRENRQQEVSDISRMLKQIARELDVPVIALSQLSRGVEQRQDKRPMMSDLRESGSLEQDADIVAFLYRDDYYNKESDKQGIIEIIIAKQRNGPVGSVELAFLKQFNKFVNLDWGHNESPPPRREPDERRQWA